MKNKSIILIFTILSLLYSNNLNGQQNCILDFQFPNGLNDVSLSPIAGITATCNIDTTKLVRYVIAARFSLLN